MDVSRLKLRACVPPRDAYGRRHYLLQMSRADARWRRRCIAFHPVPAAANLIQEAAALLRGLEARDRARVAEVVRDSVVEAQLRSIAIEAEHRERREVGVQWTTGSEGCSQPIPAARSL